MREVIAFAIVFTALFFVPIVNDRYTDSTIREKKVIDGFNEYETELIRRFKSNVEDTERDFSIENNIIRFYMPTEINSVDLDRIRIYVNMNLNTKFLIEDITVRYNRSHTSINWYVIKFSRRYN